MLSHDLSRCSVYKSCRWFYVCSYLYSLVFSLGILGWIFMSFCLSPPTHHSHQVGAICCCWYHVHPGRPRRQNWSETHMLHATIGLLICVGCNNSVEYISKSIVRRNLWCNFFLSKRNIMCVKSKSNVKSTKSRHKILCNRILFLVSTLWICSYSR